MSGHWRLSTVMNLRVSWVDVLKTMTISGLPLAVLLACSHISLSHSMRIYIESFRSYMKLGLNRILRETPSSIGYASPEAEEAYWTRSSDGRKELAYSDARYSKPREGKATEQVLYYVPRLLPTYREHQAREPSPNPAVPVVSMKDILLWHQVVYPKKGALSNIERLRIIKNHSSHDLREMRRIAKSARKHIHLGWQGHRDRYRRRWEKWLKNKGPDDVIVFEEIDQ